MSILKNFLLAVLALLIQTTLVHKLSVFDIKPDLILLVVVYVGVTGGHVQGTILGFLSGLVQDAYNPSFIGLNAFAKSVVGFGAGYGHGGIAIERPGVRALLVFLAAMVHDFVYFLVYTSGHLSRFAFLFFRQGVGSAVYTTLLGSALASFLHVGTRPRSG